MLQAAGSLSIVRRLEAEFPTIEEVGCKVGIGVATGADQVFIAPFDSLDVELDRKLPLVMTRDILTGTVKWRGLCVINPFAEDGTLVPLRRYPKLAAYLERHGVAIKARHVSKRNPGNWYRTIDRIYPALTYKPKLLIPDIKGAAHIVHEAGEFYPHHNLYFVTSDTWDLYALQAVLAFRCDEPRHRSLFHAHAGWLSAIPGAISTSPSRTSLARRADGGPRRAGARWPDPRQGSVQRGGRNALSPKNDRAANSR